MLGDTKPYEIAKIRRYSLEGPMQDYLSGIPSRRYNISEILGSKYKLIYSNKD